MNLKEFFKEHPKCAIGFSGGVDSSYLLYAGKKYGSDIKPYFVKTAFQPEFELNDARKICELLDIELNVIYLNVLSCEEVIANPKNRCYYCKKNIFGTLCKQAKADGYYTMLDGTNASDDTQDRPGMKAIDELKVMSPLKICDLTKDDIRKLSKEANLFTHDKPAYACLATRIQTGVKIDSETLSKIEHCEEKLFDLGFTDFRLRVFNDIAKLQITSKQMNLFVEKRTEITDILKPHFKNMVLDMEVR